MLKWKCHLKMPFFVDNASFILGKVANFLDIQEWYICFYEILMIQDFYFSLRSKFNVNLILYYINYIWIIIL